MEDSTSKPTCESYNGIRTEMLARVERLYKTSLNEKIFIKAVNKHVASLINYYVGLLKLEPKDFETLDNDTRHMLKKFEIHKQPACKEILRLPRD
ncbi:hypothetical protein PAEPH01_1250 [Pancytospora epiphaga]|nr:hypothetical protein PAEPH01_1250 [Pancytospora epiphaga]